jgi:hypothetical protein
VRVRDCKRAFVYSRNIASDLPGDLARSSTELRGAAKKLKLRAESSLDPYMLGGVIA